MQMVERTLDVLSGGKGDLVAGIHYLNDHDFERESNEVTKWWAQLNQQERLDYIKNLLPDIDEISGTSFSQDDATEENWHFFHIGARAASLTSHVLRDRDLDRIPVAELDELSTDGYE